MFYRVPILCRDKTEVAKVAIENGIGIGIGLNDANFSNKLLSLTGDRIEEMRINCESMNTNNLIDNGQSIIMKLKTLL